MLGLLWTLAVTSPSDTVLVVTNKPASTVSLIHLSSARILATLPTGPNPHETATSPDGRWAVTTDYGAQVPGSSLTVVDLGGRKVARTIELAHTRPHGIAFLPDSRTVAVTTETGRAVLLIDVITGEYQSEYGTGQPVSHMLALGREGRVAYTANIGPGTISRVDLTGPGEARVLKVGTQTEAIALTPDNRQAWMGSNNTGKVYVVDVVDWRVTDSLQTSGFPYRIAFTPDGALALVTNPMSDEVHLFDAGTRSRLGTIRVHGSTGDPGQPLGVAVSPDGRTAWVTLGATSEVAELDLITHSVRRHLAAGPGPDGIALAITGQ